MTAFGEWTTAEGLPAFDYRAGPVVWDRILDPVCDRHWVHVGNRRITLVADSDGRSGVWDEHTGCRWLAEHTGVSHLGELSTDGVLFGPTFSRTTAAGDGVRLVRTVLCPEGEAPWLLIRVDVVSSKALRARLIEQWSVRPRVVSLEFGPLAEIEPSDGPPVVLERVGGERAVTESGPLSVSADVDLPPGGRGTYWFRFGVDDRSELADPLALYEASLAALRERLPSASAERAPEAAAELPWHAALLTGGACVDGVLGGHTLDQGSAYSFRHGFNGAARDPLQHALALVYLEPDLALSVLRNTCSWGSPDGDLPYALDGRKQPWTTVFRPSDQNLWALWLAAEYAAATGDLAAFADSVAYHPVHGAEPVSLAEHLRRQFRFFVDEVGLGEHGHVRILNADWNDLAIRESGVDSELMAERGESVLNSAMAAWVLPVYAGLAERLGDPITAAAARTYAEQLRRRVAGEWNGRWFRRAYGPGAVVGEDALWLEVQPWAILCGAASSEQARALLATIDQTCRTGSPLGARIRRPGPIWLSINMTLIWAAARHDPDLAWDEWRRMTLRAHSTAYPDIWSGVLSGPDSYLEPESARPGQTWVIPDLGAAMQAYPVANLHSHSQPLLGYLRLLGVEPTADGRLRCGGGGLFASRTLTVRPDGSGRLSTLGDVEVVHLGGRTGWARGELAWTGTSG
ncbi:GH36-type glycosyl hydrolase domain-containing protein [Kutzneria sp. NPDC052558]|uniref:GH36-type glycosyl hydrolase domain-containing protein n=1 Tax=Kutzneria sp. NPDC052558 TaxID=3364121 RepID=UPI0037C832AE